MFSNGGVVDPGGIADSHPELFGNLKVDLVKPDTVSANHFAVGVNLSEDGTGEMVLADQKTVKGALCVNDREHLPFREGAASLHEGKITSRELIDMRAWGVKKAGCSYKNTHTKMTPNNAEKRMKTPRYRGAEPCGRTESWALRPSLAPKKRRAQMGGDA
jgi:hypothetical protein